MPLESFTTFVEFGVPAFLRVVCVGLFEALAGPTKSKSGLAAKKPAATMSGTRRRREEVMRIYFNKKRAE
jgi:hypothetical protein